MEHLHEAAPKQSVGTHTSSADEISELSQSSTDTLDRIDAAIKTLRGGASATLDPCDLWGYTIERLPGIDANTSQRMEWVKTARKDAYSLDRIVERLGEIQDSAKRVQTLIRNAIATQIGFMRFPEEILLHIVFLCLGDIEDDDHEGYMKKVQQLHRLAAVCRRFRDIIISRPKLWTKVTNDMEHDEISCFLERSKTQDMSVVMRTNNEAPRRTSKALRTVLPHCDRWRTLEISLNNPEKELPFLDVCKLLDSLDKPLFALRELSYKMMPLTLEDMERADFMFEDDEDDAPHHFYKRWNAPKLDSLVVRDCMPRPFSSMSVRLTKCWMDFMAHYWFHPPDCVAGLMEFLKSQPTLEHLEIYAERFSGTTDFPLGQKVVTLPSLVLLILKSGTPRAGVGQDERRAPRVVPPILQSLCIPLIQDMEVMFTVDDTVPNLQWILPSFNDYANLTSLALTLGHDDVDAFEFPIFDTVFRRCPNLEELTVSAWIIVLGQETFGVPPPLQVLQFENCLYTRVDEVASVIRQLSLGKHWSKFEGLFITNCPSIKAGKLVSALADLLPKEKITFLESN